MRTEQQIQRKVNEFKMRQRELQARLAELADERQQAPVLLQIDRLEEQVALLEWVLFEPTGRYHA